MNIKYINTKMAIGIRLSASIFQLTSLEFRSESDAMVKSRACEELRVRLTIDKNLPVGATFPLNNNPAVIKDIIRNASPRAIRALMYRSGRNSLRSISF